VTRTSPARREWRGIALPPVEIDHDVQRLVDQAHGVERPRMHGALRMVLGVANEVHPARKLTADREIVAKTTFLLSENRVARKP
jgi:hypothetical protein